MNDDSVVTETVVTNHLQAFLQHGFFEDFIAALPARAIERFELRSMQVDRDIAYITWNVGGDIPLGTDTFVVHDGKIISQTFAMYAAFLHQR